MPAAEIISPDTQPVTAAETITLPADESRDWYFTFGAGHRIFAQHRSDAELGRPTQGTGFDVNGWYVVIHGDFHSTRQRMYDLFGPVWSFQYSELPPLDDLPDGFQWRQLLKIPDAPAGSPV